MEEAKKKEYLRGRQLTISSNVADVQGQCDAECSMDDGVVNDRRGWVRNA
jgi:hypothetical protein